MRGKAAAGRVCALCRRITPAYAGKSHIRNHEFSTIWDHPRICGEKYCSWPGGVGQSGSPPHMRGKACRQGWDTLDYRITPAYAGKSVRAVLRYAPFVGSPPHMRGKEKPVSLTNWAQGITPAYAGKSLSRRGLGPHPKDHPRICGEKSYHRLRSIS